MFARNAALRKKAGGIDMVEVHEGQCGLCAHFGENQGTLPQIIQIRTRHEAPETFTTTCGHPQHAPLRLMVTPTSGCTGFQPVAAAGD
jgi:hypothetical protein